MPHTMVDRMEKRPAAAIAMGTAALTLIAGCSLVSGESSPTVTIRATVTATPEPTTEPTPSVTTSTEDSAFTRPLWLGQIPLEVGENNLGVPGDTPDELQDRQFEPRTWLPDPDTDEWFAQVEMDVPDDVAVRSSWESECPVSLDDLAYIVMPYWGFDGKVHTGEMLLHEDYANDVAGVFEEIFAAQFPIEEMRVISREERDSPTTGDHNVTSAFTCRKIVGAVDVWSEHASGMAIDINPFHNPFIRNEEIFPELSESYVDRDWDRAGMIHEDSAVFDAFEAIGWSWGGHWTGREDWMHFSVSGH